jgi:hypothetical protein
MFNLERNTTPPKKNVEISAESPKKKKNTPPWPGTYYPPVTGLKPRPNIGSSREVSTKM